MQISDEAVEAAAKVAFERKCGYWSELPERDRQQFRADARLILEAAAPHMLADAWQDGATDGHLYGIKATNPYRSQSKAS